jgi:hypothetical protein
MNIDLSTYLGLVIMGVGGVLLGYYFGRQETSPRIKTEDIESEAALTSFYAGQPAEAPVKTKTMRKARPAGDVSGASKRKPGRPRKHPIE